MYEGFAVISGEISSDDNLNYITSVAKERYFEYKTAHHEWIDSVEKSKYRTALDTIRRDPSILKKIQGKFPNMRIKSVTEADEVYWAVSPKGAIGSDRALVDCHYDSPFSWFPTGGIVFYRVIIACNENNTVTTMFPDENILVKMNTKDFHGLDYNKDIHCVEGSIPEGKYRVLLKMHYMVIPPGSEGYELFVRKINVWWTVLSREMMRMSAKPKFWYEYIAAFIVNFCRIIYNYFYMVSILIFILLCILYKNIILKTLSLRRKN